MVMVIQQILKYQFNNKYKLIKDCLHFIASVDHLRLLQDIQLIIINMNNQGNQNIAAYDCMQVINKLPLFNRFLYFSLAICYLLNLLTTFPSKLIACSILNTFENKFVWTLLSSAIYVRSLLFLTIVIFNFSTFLNKLQEKTSTIILFLKFFISNAVIQLITLAIQLAIYSEDDQITYGVEGVWMSMVVKYCFYNRSGDIKLCCFPLKIKKVLYPFVLTLVCMLLQLSFNIGLIVGLICGFADIFLETYVKIISLNACYTKINTLIKLSSISCAISTEGSGGVFQQQCLYVNLQQQGDSQQKIAVQPRQKNDAFSNSQGIRIGDY